MNINTTELEKDVLVNGISGSDFCDYECAEYKEIFIQKQYKTMSGFVRAVRHYMAETLGEYPEDALTGHYSSDEEMEVTIKRTGKYYYESKQLNIDIEMDSHIYICTEW